MVVLDNYVDSPLVARVGCDSAEGIRQAVRYLWSKGHDRIGFLGGEPDSIVTIERKQAYSDALAELGLVEDPAAVKYGCFSAKGTKKRILEIAETGVTAVVCISDLLACTAVKELIRAGYSVPEDISVTGYDNLPPSRVFAAPDNYAQPEPHTHWKDDVLHASADEKRNTYQVRNAAPGAYRARVRQGDMLPGASEGEIMTSSWITTIKRTAATVFTAAAVLVSRVPVRRKHQT